MPRHRARQQSRHDAAEQSRSPTRTRSLAVSRRRVHRAVAVTTSAARLSISKSRERRTNVVTSGPQVSSPASGRRLRVYPLLGRARRAEQDACEKARRAAEGPTRRAVRPHARLLLPLPIRARMSPQALGERT